MPQDIARVLIRPEATILEAIKTIDAGGIQIAIIADESGTLLGTVTDGDVRRGLLAGVGTEQPVRLIMNPKPRVLRQGYTRESAIEMMRRLSIHQLPVVSAENRVTGIELFDDLVAPREEHTWVVLMAGGLGTRLRPLTENLPKPMIPVGGRPLLETIVRNFEAQGYRRIFLSVNYKSEIIREHFGDGLKFGVSIDYLTEDKRMGTAGALSLLPSLPLGPVIVMNADLLTSVNFRHLVDFHRQQGARATMCVREYSFQVPYGVVQTDGSQLTALIEKPVHNFFVNAGVYVIDPSALVLLPPDTPFDMPQLFEAIASNGGTASVFPIHEYWLDIGRIDDLERAQDDFRRVFDI
jgi:dTDP-glucose pyrophosphorylase/predicted transcriptional regulator